MKEFLRYMSIFSYALPLILIPSIILIESSEDKDLALLIGLAGAIMSTAILLVGWAPRVQYPYPNLRRKAIILWLYGTPLTVVIGLYIYIEGLSWWMQPIVYFLSFFYLTTLTFGVLPKYGGAYLEFLEVEERQRRLWKHRPENRKWPASADRVLVSIDEICKTCLSVVLPEDVRCWRCGDIIRAKTRLKEEWTKDSKSIWTKKKQSGQILWQREWHPDYYYVDERGVTTNFGVSFVFAIVKEDGCWSLHAMPRTPVDEVPHVVLLKRGRERNPRAARKSVNSVVLDVDLKKVVEEN